MKALITFSLLISSMIANAGDIKLRCDVVSLLDSNVFEEGLGETGDSQSDSDSQSVSAEFTKKEKYLSIGQHSFYKEKDVKLTATETATDIKISAQTKAHSVKLNVYKNSRKGVVLQKDNDQPKYEVVAEVDCNDYQKVKTLILSGKAQSKLVTKNAIPEEVFTKINSINVDFEMGDGYYDIQSEKLFELSSGGKVIGYALETSLSYSEGDDVEVSTYFLANGVRFSGPNE